ncbi:MAG: TldD/PmbA family protein [Bacilli bacterium]|nr:TldD/PmbA family protein [Bacilli bacterium]
MNYNDFFKLAQEKKLDKIQITENHKINSSFKLINGKLDSYDDLNLKKYNIKAEKNGKTIKIISDYLSEDILDNILFNIENTDSKYEDEYLENIENIERKKIVDFSIDEDLKNLKDLDSLRDKYPQIDKLILIFSEEYSNTCIKNSNNVDISTDSHLCNFIVEVVVKNKEELINYDKEQIFVNKEEINFKNIIEEAIISAIKMSNKEKLQSKKYNLILDSKVSSNIIDNITKMLSATNIRNNISCLNNKINSEIFSNKLTIIEDPTNRDFPGYRLFDDEGTKTFKKCIIENGVIKTELFNIKEAKLKNVASTGNGYGNIETRNMYLLPGKNSLEELLKKLDNGIYITNYMEASGTSINYTTGNISIQIFGFIVENGKIKSGFEPCIMTTTIFELLSNIEDLSDKLCFTNIKTSSPALLINDISISA